MSSGTSVRRQNLLWMLGSAVGSATAIFLWRLRPRCDKDPERDATVAQQLVWTSITGALNTAMLYTGDRLDLYAALRELCHEPGSSVTSDQLAELTGLHARWIHEWLVQQAAMGVLQLIDNDEELHFQLPAATAMVLANPESPHYDVAMVQAVPSLVNRARNMLPDAFVTGTGRPYDEPDVAQGIDRYKIQHVRHVFVPHVLPKAGNFKVVEMLRQGIQVCDLGCGGGVLIRTLAEAYPNSTFHGYDISLPALERAKNCRNIFQTW